MLTRSKRIFEDMSVILLPEEGVEYERVVNVLDACGVAKIKKISFAK